MKENRYFDDFNVTKNIREYDYTGKAINAMNRIMDSKEFEEMDSEAIYKYICEGMELVEFGDYLKRHIYKVAGFDESFLSIPDDIYVDIIKDTFWQNNTPFSFEPTTAKPRAIIKRWINQASSTRDVVFLLGFGLSMTAGEVENMLQKALLEDTFDFSNPRECIFWYCYHNNRPYAKAMDYLSTYEEMGEQESYSQSLWNLMKSNPKMYMIGEKELLMYLSYLKFNKVDVSRGDAIYKEFRKLYDQACAIVGNLLHNGEKEAIGPADVERILCSGIPRTESGNVQKMSFSTLNRHFEHKRMTRQRLNNILSGKSRASRFDLITLMFLKYSEEVEPDWPAERYMRFIDEMNDVLRNCGMMDVYPVNPYEACILMCLLMEYPLAAYAEVWEHSYL